MTFYLSISYVKLNRNSCFIVGKQFFLILMFPYEVICTELLSYHLSIAMSDWQAGEEELRNGWHLLFLSYGVL